MVGHQVLVLSIGVRVPIPQQFRKKRRIGENKQADSMIEELNLLGAKVLAPTPKTIEVEHSH